MEQLGIELALIREASVAGGGFTYSATILVPATSCRFDELWLRSRTPQLVALSTRREEEHFWPLSAVHR